MGRALPAPLTAGAIADRIGVEIRGDRDLPIHAVASLDLAKSGELAFFADKRFAKLLSLSEASAVIAPPDAVLASHAAHLVSASPHAAFAKVLAQLFISSPNEIGQNEEKIHHSTATVLSAFMSIQSGVGAYSYVGENTVVHPGAQIGANVTIGRDCTIYPNVVIRDHVRIGDRCIVQPGAVIGADGFGFQPTANGWLKVPQVGTVVIGDDVEIGANTTIDRGAIEDTVIGNGVKIDNLVQIAHNVRIGEHTAIAGCAGIAGSAVIGKRCMIGGAAMIQGHIEICDEVVISGATYVTDSILEKGRYTAVFPYGTHREWMRMAATLRRSAKSHTKKPDSAES
jgi:UDP-3-O-[3-hydroxymyristoyl] glucosamine N-acyltransferase